MIKNIWRLQNKEIQWSVYLVEKRIFMRPWGTAGNWAPVRNTGQRTKYVSEYVQYCNDSTVNAFILCLCVYFHVNLTTTYEMHANHWLKKKEKRKPCVSSSFQWTEMKSKHPWYKSCHLALVQAQGSAQGWSESGAQYRAWLSCAGFSSQSWFSIPF